MSRESKDTRLSSDLICSHLSHKARNSVSQTIDADYSKKFSLKRKDENFSRLPLIYLLFQSNKWKDDYLMQVKDELNSVKSKLNSLNLRTWHNHTRFTNHAGEIIGTLRRRVAPEFLTQAWCKFYEMVSTYDVIPESAVTKNRLRSLHLCEAPGAFITSLNHYLKVNHPDMEWDWRATTLNPSFEGNSLSYMVNDDRFILLTLEKWCFGEDETGDLFSSANLTNVIDALRPLEPIMLVTADGSIDCQQDPGEQEQLVSALHLCEAITALNILDTGGTFILKMFTMYESDTICLLYMLSAYFETMEVFKPVTSKEGNSEVYLICLNYRGRKASVELLDLCLSIYGEKITLRPMFSKDQIPSHFMERIRECATFFKDLQVSVIERNLRIFSEELYPNEKDFIFHVKKEHARCFLTRYNIIQLKMPYDYIVGNDNIKSNIPLCMDPRNDDDVTYLDKKALETSDYLTYLTNLRTQLHKIKNCWTYPDYLIHWLLPERDFSTQSMPIVPLFGKPIETISSSKFCLGNILSVWNDLRKLNIDNLINDTGDEYCNLKDIEEVSSAMAASRLTICDLNAIDWNKSANEIHSLVINEISNKLKKMIVDETFVLKGVHLLTRFLVSLVHLIGHSFTKVGFCNPVKCGNAVIFYSLKSKRKLITFLEEIKTICFGDVNGKTIHSLFPVTKLCDGESYKLILIVNHVTLRKVCYNMTVKMIPH